MLFEKSDRAVTENVVSPDAESLLRKYISSEQIRAKILSDKLNAQDGILVWGCGDNFYRSATNGGPLENHRNLILLDRTTREFSIGDIEYKSIDPSIGLDQFTYPVAITVSEGSSSIAQQILEKDPNREIFFL